MYNFHYELWTTGSKYTCQRFHKAFFKLFFIFLNRMLAKLIGFVLGMSVCRAVQGLYISYEC